MIKIKSKQISFDHLKRIVKKIDWIPVAEILTRTKDNRGRKTLFKPVNCLRAFILGAYLEIDDDTELARRIAQHKEYLEFCGVNAPPSHDVLTSFRKKYEHLTMKVFSHFDSILENLGAFRNDHLSCDGTDIPVPFKNKKRPHRYHFGAKSDKKKFHGFWLMIATSVNHQIARSFVVGYAREGQIELCKDLLNYRRIDDSDENFYFIFDGIFDCEEIYKLVVQQQGKLPIINYNKRGSSIETIEDLPEDDWRFLYNPLLHYPDFICKIYKKRNASERHNGHSKMYTLISKIANKIKKSRSILKHTVEHITTFTFILEQLMLLTEYKDKLRQVTLSDFM